MSKTKKILEENKWLTMSLYDVLKIKYGDKTSKYLPLFVKLIQDETDNVNQEYMRYGEGNIVYTSTSYIESYFYRLFEDELYIKFIDYIERGLIKTDNLSLSKEEMNKLIMVAEFRLIEKGLEKEIKVWYEDEEWLMLSPLTYESSLKYGYGTKWCTSSKNNPYTFIDYASRGMLIYYINKQTGDKFATYRDRNDKLTSWDVKDEQISFFDIDLSVKIYNKIKEVVKLRGTLLEYGFKNDRYNDEVLGSKSILDYSNEVSVSEGAMLSR